MSIAVLSLFKVVSESEVVKDTEIRVFRLREWGVEGEEEGQTGCRALGAEAGLEVGVREGTQKEGRLGLEDYGIKNGGLAGGLR